MLRTETAAGPVEPRALLFVAALVLGIFSGHWGLLGVPLPLDRLALAASVGCIGWGWLRGRPLGVRWGAVHVAMLAVLVLCAGSAAAFGSATDRSAVIALLDRVAVPYAGFVLAPVALATPASRRLLVRALTWTGLYVAVTAVVSVWGPDWLLFPRYLADPSVGIAHGRARGPSAEAVGTGLLVITCGTAAAITATRTTGYARVLAAVTVVVSLLAGLLSLTRSIWGGMLLVVLAAAVVLPAARRRLLALGALAAGLVVVVLTLVPGVASAALGRLGTSRSLEDRAYTNDAAIRMLLEHPLTGVGWGRFVSQSPDYIVQSDTAPLTNVGIEVHNVFLSRGAELGVPGLALTALVLLLGPVRGVLPSRGRWTPLEVDVRVLALAAVVSWVATALVTGLSFAFANLLAWALAGLAYDQTRRRAAEPAAPLVPTVTPPAVPEGALA